MIFSYRIQTVFTLNESRPSKMAAQLFQIAVYDLNGCFEMNVFQDGSEEHLRQSLAANGCYNIQIFSVQLDDISDENPLVLAFRLLEQDGSYGPEFMKMELSGRLLNRTDGKGVEIYVRLLDDLTASVICRGTETTQTSGTKALKDVFCDLNVPLSNQGVIAVDLGNILDLDGSPTQEVSRDESDCSDNDSQEEVFYDAVDQLSSCDESDLPEESETDMFYDCYEDLSEDQAVESCATEAQTSSLTETDLAVEIWMSEDGLTDDGKQESFVAVQDKGTGISGKTQDPCGSQIHSSGIDFLISFNDKLEFFRSKVFQRAEKRQKEDNREDLTDGIRMETLPVVSDFCTSSLCEDNKNTAICSLQINSIDPKSVEETLPVKYDSSSEDENEDLGMSPHETERKRLQSCASYLPDVITEDPTSSSQSEADVVGEKKK
ncbi:uncharacterized protein LOC130432867 [Triplophysa dalaica]|uniref:uncharacterized protein LOC130432867 n=1 Tax=Triplophysa dalaica TaxID=1582913 RepID=UPI0024DF58B6|nr:uncharacterized protein LOC130432867 [Triplophysa dalaica]XP_056618414.1 uncharacterized protein LOC130432867 [Triplophysa dalaica]XP_056618415.1 uncharacterized protein LOC130432867 [Triplophysa dalaica]